MKNSLTAPCDSVLRRKNRVSANAKTERLWLYKNGARAGKTAAGAVIFCRYFKMKSVLAAQKFTLFFALFADFSRKVNYGRVQKRGKNKYYVPRPENRY